MFVEGLNSVSLITVIIGQKNMIHCFKLLFLGIVFFSSIANSQPYLFQNSNELASENVEKFLKEFVQQPHPMGSDAQKKTCLKI